MSLALTASLATAGQGFRPATATGARGGVATPAGITGFVANSGGSFFSVGGHAQSRKSGILCRVKRVGGLCVGGSTGLETDEVEPCRLGKEFSCEGVTPGLQADLTASQAHETTLAARLELSAGLLRSLP